MTTPYLIKCAKCGESWWDAHVCSKDVKIKQAVQPDCRTCFYGDTPDEFNEYQWKCLSLNKGCINGNQYKPVERVVLWRTE